LFQKRSTLPPTRKLLLSEGGRETNLILINNNSMCIRTSKGGKLSISFAGEVWMFSGMTQYINIIYCMYSIDVYSTDVNVNMFTDIPTLPILPGVSQKFMQSPGLPIFIKFSRFFRIFRKYHKNYKYTVFSNIIVCLDLF
jgi:hypothetical protein